MKKQYIKPVTAMIDIETEQMMAASPGQEVKVSGDSGEGFLNNIYATNGGDALSKDHTSGIWDEDDY